MYELRRRSIDSTCGGQSWVKGLAAGAIASVGRMALLAAALIAQGVAQTTPAPTGVPQLGVQDYSPITGRERAKWLMIGTARGAFTGSVFSAAIGTATGNPEEYPNTWEGFGRRYRMSVAGVALSRGLEAGLGSLWGEDPRYFPSRLPTRGNIKAKLKHVVVSTFTAKNRNGQTMPAYAFYIAQPANNFLANTWRVDSDSTVGAALMRTSFGVLGRMTANAFAEFRGRSIPSRGGNPTPATPTGTNLQP